MTLGEEILESWLEVPLALIILQPQTESLPFILIISKEDYGTVVTTLPTSRKSVLESCM